MPSTNTYAATSYTLTVGESEITSDTASGTGFSWDGSTGTLTLSSYNGGSISMVDYGHNFDKLSVVVSGTNQITSTNTAGIISPYDLALSGNGLLTVSSNNTCINTSLGNTTITGGTYNLTKCGDDGSIGLSTVSFSATNATISMPQSYISTSTSGTATVANSTITTYGIVFGSQNGATSVSDSTLKLNGGGYLAGETTTIINSQITTTHENLGLVANAGNITLSGANTTFEGNGVDAFQGEIVLNDGLGLSGGRIVAVNGGQGVYDCDGNKVVGNIKIAQGLSSTTCDADATLASASTGTTVANPDTADTDWIYGLVAAILTGAFFLGRRFYLKH